MTMTRLVPFRSAQGGLQDVTVLQNRLSSIFHHLARPDSGTSESPAAGNFVPAVDVYEDAQNLVLKLEVPGIPKEALDIHVEGRSLTVKGERTFSTGEKEENFQRVERRYGSFVRSFTLPSTVDTDNVEASAQDGVLSITLAKKAEAKPKQIQVRAAAPVSEQPKQGEAAAA